jgi:hypothetical protein
MLRRLAFTLAAAVPLLVAACSDSPTAPSASLEGSYSLRTVNGANVPVTLATMGADRVDITGGTLTLNNNGTFSGQLAFRFVFSGATTNQSESSSGTWTASGNTVTLSSEGDVTIAVWDQNARQLTITESFDEFGTMALVFRK